MGILSWILLGLIAGWLAGLVMRGGGYGVIGDIVVGILGALIGGWLYTAITGAPGITGFDLGSILIAFIGAVILIAVLRAVAGRRAAV
jgi:uncharacterized membrane protein YeaQ/YmgE (transglycosylase-associated protein family)